MAIGERAIALMLWWANRKPVRRKWVNQQIVSRMLPDVNRIERSYKVFNVPEPPIHRETEWAFSLASLLPCFANTATW
jgi:hypothetical protein